jgi:hypothetical protein
VVASIFLAWDCNNILQFYGLGHASSAPGILGNPELRASIARDLDQSASLSSPCDISALHKCGSGLRGLIAVISN